jgi:uncharacterized protein YjbJ (UPF0337 family)
MRSPRRAKLRNAPPPKWNWDKRERVTPYVQGKIHLSARGFSVAAEPGSLSARSTFTDEIAQQRRLRMNWDRIEGNWKQFTGKVKEKWGQLTDDDLTKINGNREQLEGILQQRYGYAKDKAREEIDSWSNGL